MVCMIIIDTMCADDVRAVFTNVASKSFTVFKSCFNFAVRNIFPDIVLNVENFCNLLSFALSYSCSFFGRKDVMSAVTIAKAEESYIVTKLFELYGHSGIAKFNIVFVCANN